MSAYRYFLFGFVVVLCLGSVWAQPDDLPPIYFGFGSKCALDSSGSENGYCDFFGKGQPLYHKYRLIILNRNDCFLSAWPVNIVGKDTMYSASDGGFYSGPCQYRKTRGSLTINGKYDVLSYAKMLDSSYSFEFAIEYDNLHDKAKRLTLKKFLFGKNPHRE